MRTPARRPPGKTRPMLMDFTEPPSEKSRTYFARPRWVKHNPSAMLPDGSTDLDFGFDDRLASAATLPSRCYTDGRFLQIERERVFGRTWQLVGREDRVSSTGRYFTTDVAGEPLLIARGADSRVRALSNVCRHRAGPVAAGDGACQAFRCGYHGWSYALDGR